MTASDVVFDTWAWLEVLQGTRKGAALQGRFLARTKVHTSAYAVAELAAKLADAGLAARAGPCLARLASAGRIVPVTEEIALQAGLLRSELRRKVADASLADAVMLATARSLGLPLVSSDSAFRGLRDVIAG